jgi:nicotinamidase-related amidase
LLRQQLGVDRLTLVGQVTEQCVLYSALDAYVRHFAVRVPVDAVVAIDDELADAALRMIARNMRGELFRVGDQPGASAPRSTSAGRA